MTALALAANERRADIAVLKTCGASARKIVLIFLLQGAIIGAVGAIGGSFLGIIICEVCNRFGLISLPPDVYTINSVNLQPEIVEVIAISATAFLLSLTASILPSVVAARIKPLENVKS